MQRWISRNLGALAAGLAFVGTLAIQQPSWADATEVIKLNNDAVTCLNKGEYDGAIKALEKALEIDPSYKLGRTNLAIAYNNKALTKAQSDPRQALSCLHNALFIDNVNPTTRENLTGTIKLLGKNPDSASDRIALAEEAKKAGDHRSAVIEYLESLNQNYNKETVAKVHESFNALPQNDKNLIKDRLPPK